MGNYSKLIAAILGPLVGILVTWLATKGLGSCGPGPDGVQVCTLFGYTSAQIVGTMTTIGAALFVFFFPKNVPSS